MAASPASAVKPGFAAASCDKAWPASASTAAPPARDQGKPFDLHRTRPYHAGHGKGNQVGEESADEKRRTALDAGACWRHSPCFYVALNWPRWQLRAQMAAGFGARIACSCRYIEGRGLDSCKSDFAGLKGMGLVRFTDDPAQRTVHASVPLLARRKAAFKAGLWLPAGQDGLGRRA